MLYFLSLYIYKFNVCEKKVFNPILDSDYKHFAYVIQWYFNNLLDYDLFHYIRLLYTGCDLDYALSFYRRTINFIYYYYV